MLKLFMNGVAYTDNNTFEKRNILVEDGVIKDADYRGEAPDVTVDCSGMYILPGLVDVHTHGRSALDFNNVDSTEKVHALRESYAKAGTTTIFATLASAAPESLNTSIDAIREGSAPEGGIANIAGIHMEGRYLNQKRRGAHAAELLAPLDSDELSAFLDRIAPLPAHVSCAAELEGGEKFVKTAISKGATVGMAHSDATWDEAVKAVEWGVTSFTHTYNAMRPIHHREPGNMVASLMSDGAFTELICDGEHVHPAMIKMASRLKAADRLVLITDSMEAAGCPEGQYQIAGLPVFVKDGRAVNNEGALAGSTLSLFKALCNYMKFTGLTLEKALPCATSNPAAEVGITDCGRIADGLRADFFMIKDKNAPELESVWVLGEEVK